MKMRFVSRLMALCLTLLYMMMIPACAEVPFLRHTSGWSLESTPLDVMLTADVSSHMPFDDDRLAMLTPITDLLGMRLITGEEGGSVTISIAGEDVLTLAAREDAVQLSCLPDMTFTAQGNPMDLLLGEAVTNAELDFFGIRGDAEALLEAGETLLANIPEAFESYRKTTKGDTNISGMGKAKYRYDFTVPASDAQAMQQTLLEICPDGWLKEIIAGLTFTGKQTLRTYHNSSDVALRMEYTGTCGYGEDLRNVNLIWRMRRDDAGYLDEITLRTPVPKGSDKNNLTFTRSVKINKAGAIEMTGEFAYTITRDGESDVRKGDFSLKNAFIDGADVITGEINLRHLPAGDNKYDQYEFVPALTISGTEASPVIQGTLIVREKWGSGVTEEALLTIDAKRAELSLWEERPQVVDLSAMTDEALARTQAQAAAATATALVRPLIQQLGADAEWFFRDLEADDIQTIMDAAGAAPQ